VKCAVGKAEGDIAIVVCEEFYFGYLTIAPLAIYRHTTSCHEPLKRAGMPRCGECGEKVYEVIVALEEHLHNTRCTAKVTVYLEWWVGAEEVWVCATALSCLGECWLKK
jgi:hypothetical protein